MLRHDHSPVTPARSITGGMIMAPPARTPDNQPRGAPDTFSCKDNTHDQLPARPPPVVVEPRAPAQHRPPAVVATINPCRHRPPSSVPATTGGMDAHAGAVR
jgi:hypothetical protein